MESITTQQVLSAITIGLLVIFFAPRIIAMNAARGTALRNTALWLLIFVGLIWVYQFVYPEAQNDQLIGASTQPQESGPQETTAPAYEPESTPLPPGQAM